MRIPKKCKSVSIDDFAKRRRHTYGTVLIDSETREIIDLLDSRKEEDVALWLSSYPSIERISRDGSHVFAAAISTALPKAIQISDRFHILRNLTDRAIKEIHKRMARIVKIKEEQKTGLEANEPHQSDSESGMHTSAYLDKIILMDQVRTRYQQCMNYAKIGQEFGLDSRTVKVYVLGNWTPPSEKRSAHPLTPFSSIIENAVKAGMKLTRLLEVLQKDLGYLGDYSSLKVFVQKRKQKQMIESTAVVHRSNIERLLFDRGISDLALSTTEQKTIIAFLKANIQIQEILDIVTGFRIVIGARNKERLDRWILDKRLIEYSEILKFRDFVYRDYDAILMGITEPESNGIAEGKVNKIKTIKRQMYGRCSFDLLRQKVLASEYST